MPTGYTARITKDMPLETFVWICARAFVALIEMRDDSMDAPIPQRLEPSSYHRDRLAEARARLAEVSAWTLEQARGDQIHALGTMVASDLHYDAKNAETKAAYERMLSLVDGWEPPSPDHVELKKFMREQISGSIDFDCKAYPRPPRLEISPEDWKAREIARAQADVTRHEKEWEAEMKRTAERNEWIAQLRDSLAPKATA